MEKRPDWTTIYLNDKNLAGKLDKQWHLHAKDQITSRFQGEERNKWIFDEKQLDLIITPKQRKKKGPTGYQLKKELETEAQPVAGIPIMRFFAKYRMTVPLKWTGYTIFFWGNIVADWRGELFVFYMYCDGANSYIGYRWLGEKFNRNCHVLIVNNHPPTVKREEI